MKRQSFHQLAFFIALGLAFLIGYGCEQNPPPEPLSVDKLLELSEYESGQVEISEPQIKPGTTPDTAPAVNDIQCVTTSYEFAPAHSTIWDYGKFSDLLIGRLYRAESVAKGSPASLTYKMDSGLTVSLLGPTLTGKHTVALGNSQETTREAINALLTTPVSGPTPAQADWKIKRIVSKEDLTLNFGASLTVGNSLNAEALFDFSRQDEHTKVFARYEQIYFSLVLNGGETPENFFAQTPMAGDLEHRPVYLHKVDYGRVIHFAMETNRNEEEVLGAFEAAFSISKDSADDPQARLRFEAKYAKLFEGTTIQVLILGGAAQAATPPFNRIEDLFDFIEAGANYSLQSPGVPLAYTFKTLGTNEDFKFINRTEFKQTICKKIVSTYDIQLDAIRCKSCGSGEDKVYGLITASTNRGDQLDTLMYRGKNNLLVVDGQLGTRPGTLSKFKFRNPDVSEDYLLIHTNLNKKRTLSDQSYGGPTEWKFPLNQLNGDQPFYRVTREASGEAGTLELDFIITPIN